MIDSRIAHRRVREILSSSLKAEILLLKMALFSRARQNDRFTYKIT